MKNSRQYILLFVLSSKKLKSFKKHRIPSPVGKFHFKSDNKRLTKGKQNIYFSLFFILLIIMIKAYYLNSNNSKYL